MQLYILAITAYMLAEKRDSPILFNKIVAASLSYALISYFLICVKSCDEGLPVPPLLPNAEKAPLPPWLLKAPNPPSEKI